MKKRSPVEHGGEKREIVYRQREDQREKESQRKKKAREEGKSVVLFMPPSALVFTFFPPASCFTSAI